MISLVVVAIYTGLSQGIQPTISLNHGAGNPSNMRCILKYALITVLLSSDAIYTVLFFGASRLVSDIMQKRYRKMSMTGMPELFTCISSSFLRH